MDQYTCGKCRQLLDADQYPPSARHNGGYCRPCRRDYEKAKPRKRYKPDRPYSKTCYNCGAKREPDDKAHIGYCGDCYRAYSRERYRTGGRRITEYCSMCGEKRAEDDRTHQAYCPRCFYIWTLNYKYGITPDDYQAMLDAQGGGCAICGVQQSQAWKESWRHPLEIDHCHTTGKVRGLVCSSCNQMLAAFDCDSAKIRRAIEYVENAKRRNHD